MNPNQALWEKGDFTQIADTMRESGEAFAKGLGITTGLKVLDLGCGDGTTALPEAKQSSCLDPWLETTPGGRAFRNESGGLEFKFQSPM